MPKPITKTFRERASSLITTLLVLVVLTTIVVAFLQSMSVERSTSKSYLNRLKAEQAAEAGVQVAQALVRNTINLYPDSSTVWETNLAGLGGAGTAIYYWSPAATMNAQLYYVPLVSAAASVNVTYANRASSVTNTTNTVNINTNRYSPDSGPWVGTAPDGTVPTNSAPWVNITDSNNIVVARYAFWVEDESFKANLLLSTNAPVGSKTLTNAYGVPLQGIFARVTNTATALANSVDSVRTAFAGVNQTLPTLATINQASGVTNTLASTVKFISSTTSSSYNFSRTGFRRINLNLIPSSSTVATVARLELDKIVYGITNNSPHFGQRFYRAQGSINMNSFDVATGSGPSSGNHELIYVTKIAANIRDYISTNNQPTLVNNDATFSVRAPGVPTLATGASGGGLTGVNEVVAIGKKNVPACLEYGLRARLVSLSIPGKPTGQSNPGPGANYVFYLDHYLEFANYTDRDITLADLGSNPFLKIYNQPDLDTDQSNGGTVIPPGAPNRDITIPLSGFVDGSGNPLVFKANSVTVLTTDDAPNATFTPNIATIFRPNTTTLASIDSKRHFTGITKKLGSSSSNDVKTANGYSLPYVIDITPRTTAATDYETEFLLGNDAGQLEGFCTLPAGRSGGAGPPIRINNDTFITNPTINNIQFFVRGGSLFGNNSPTPSAGQTGDGRSANEQLFINVNSGNNDHTRYNLTLDNSSVPGTSTLNSFNTNFVDPRLFADYSTSTSGSANAPARIARAPMASIGELGNIYDPVRYVGIANDITVSRGGGRTLRVGQSDYRNLAQAAPTAALSTPAYFGLWDGTQTNASRMWPSWRLCDFFSVDSSLEKPGTINPNGALRDNGAAVRAILEGLTLSGSDNPSTLAGANLGTNAVDQIITALTNRLTSTAPYAIRGGPFYERGEFSELDVFNQGTNFPVSGTNSSVIIDRSREELFRRIVEIITTRGSVFTVYSVGQSVRPIGGTLKVESTATAKVTFKVSPVYLDSAGAQTSPPADSLYETANSWPSSANLSNRFKAPDAYEIKVISAPY